MKTLFALMLSAVCLVVWGSGIQQVEAKGPKGKNPQKLGNPTPESIFKYLDKDGDEKLTAKELKDVKTGAEATESASRFKKWDTDANGTLTLDEYKAGVASTPLPTKQKPAKKKK